VEAVENRTGLVQAMSIGMTTAEPAACPSPPVHVGVEHRRHRFHIPDGQTAVGHPKVLQDLVIHRPALFRSLPEPLPVHTSRPRAAGRRGSAGRRALSVGLRASLGPPVPPSAQAALGRNRARAGIPGRRRRRGCGRRRRRIARRDVLLRRRPSVCLAPEAIRTYERPTVAIPKASIEDLSP